VILHSWSKIIGVDVPIVHQAGIKAWSYSKEYIIVCCTIWTLFNIYWKLAYIQQ